MTKAKRDRIERESFERWLASNWPKMLGGNIANAVKIAQVESRGNHWIFTSVGTATV